LYLDWIESTLLPLASESYRVDINRDHLGILGSSLGGLISCYGGWTRPQVYGKVGCMSSSFWWDENDFQKRIIPASVPATPVPTFYVR
jgi:predicted alpha/beta superfamily hydrolase